MGETIKSLLGSIRDSADEGEEETVPEELEEEYKAWLEDSGEKDSEETRKGWMLIRKKQTAAAEGTTSLMGGMGGMSSAGAL